jgi:L-ascorbate metabolism protein UlaG (beta-lactamase superfamily)
MSWYWLIVVVAILVVLYPFQGWITWLVHQRRRERRFAVVAPPRRPTPGEWRNDRVSIGWLEHATLLMNLHGKNVLTDPVFGASVGLHLPLGISFGPRRLLRCALNPEELPRLDLIVQSHAHMDHLDTRSWRRLRPGHARSVASPAVVMAAHNARYIRWFGFEPVRELDWGESVEVAGVKVTAVEVKHWGERLPWSRAHGYNAYLLEREGAAILFGGDTAYTESFRRACAGKKIDVAVLPIGGYQPYIRAHASPEQAWQMFCEIGVEYLIPIHHGTFILSYEPPDEPLQRLLAAAGKEAHRIVIREVGETFVLPAKAQ